MGMAIDIFSGLGGWAEGLMAAGHRVIGFDIERHEYGDHRYPAQLVIQDARTLHGSQFRDARLIVASPPCQEFSYMAMPWSRAKQIARALRGEDEFPDGYTGSRTVAELTELFDTCFRIQREAIEAAGRHIPMVVENVRGAQPWVGRAKWNYGSYYLWGDVPALMPIVRKPTKNTGGSWFIPPEDRNCRAKNCPDGRKSGDSPIKNQGGSWFRIGSPENPVHTPHMTNPAEHDRGVKGFTPHGQPLGQNELGRKHGSKSSARKAASAMIAKIPFKLAHYIGEVYS